MLSIVIPAYNEQKIIGTCLEALCRQHTKQSFEVIVVDNNSTDQTAHIAQTYSGKLRIRVIKEKQKGRGAARAAGFAAVSGDIILSTDADSVVPTGWIDDLTRPFADPSVIATTGPGLVNDSKIIVNTICSTLLPIFMTVYRVLYGHYWLTGFNFAIRKSAYRASGGFDPTLNALEDIELGFRVYKLGRIAYLKNTRVAMSGRRFERNVFGGFLPYLQQFINFRLRGRKSLEMDDVR